MDYIGVLIGVLIFITIYFLPTLIAVRKDHHNKLSIFLLNLLLGWTFLGWVASLIWSVSRPPPQQG